MVTKRQIERLKNKLSYLNPQSLYLFDEIDGELINSKGEKIPEKEFKKLSQQENVLIIIDDIQPEG